MGVLEADQRRVGRRRLAAADQRPDLVEVEPAALVVVRRAYLDGGDAGAATDLGLEDVRHVADDDLVAAAVVCVSSETRLPIVPLATKIAASLPMRSAAIASRRLTVGSSPSTSSPISALAIAWRMEGDGRVTVSERRSMVRDGCCHWFPTLSVR